MEPYSNPNFKNTSEYIVNVQLMQWRYLPELQKNLIIQDKILNARTQRDLELAQKLLNNEKQNNNEKQSNNEKQKIR
jgi:hypothetical protein